MECRSKLERRNKMGFKKFFLFCLLTTCALVFTGQSAFSGADWQEKQKQIFAKIPVKPGDLIDITNWEKVKDLVPEPFLELGVKTGDWPLKIGEFEYDFDFNAEYYEISAKNKGKYILGDRKEIIDITTGKYPMFIQGRPFPEIDVKNDPDGAIKVMHNKDLGVFMQGSYEGLTYPKDGNLKWIGRNSGYERGVGFLTQRCYWWNRPRGEEIPNPRELKTSTRLLTTYPYDLNGTATLYLRHLDGRDDSVYAYVAAIRRVKRLSGANRSDPQMGSDQTMDDAGGFNGQIESMTWTYIDEKIILRPTWSQDAKEIRKLWKNKFGAQEFDTNDCTKMGYMKAGWTGAPWAYTNLVWIPREMYVLQAVPLDPYYNYGKMVLYVDKLTEQVTFNMKYTKAGEFWKYVVQATGPGLFESGRKFFSIDGPMCVIDAKTDHASNLDMDGNLMNWDTPRVNPQYHTPADLRLLTK